MLHPPVAGFDLDGFVATDYARVVSAVARITGSRHDAEDAVQDALVKLLRQTEHIGSVAAWVTVVASNGARSGLRRRGAGERAVDRIGAAMDPESASGPDVDLQRALAGLPRQQRQAATLYYFLGEPVAEVARGLGVSEGTVKTHLSRARAALAASLHIVEDGDV